ncbi:MAG: hypothetical protein G01um101444_34 [Parcubacteria group bacterium Gr01-1014_44]|nr:MAG: hypothetical protein G01um101444_34 [Parcubacteria group bacterium Gr01-1014_44]
MAERPIEPKEGLESVEKQQQVADDVIDNELQRIEDKVNLEQARESI